MFLHQQDAQFVCLSEHWMEKEQSLLTTISGYHLAASFSRERHIHGGVAIFSKYNQTFYKLDLSKFSTEFVCECVGITFRLCNKKIALICIYHSCNYNTSEENNFNKFIAIFNTLLCHVTEKYEHILICGDFNIDNLGQSLSKDIFFDLLESFNLKSILPFEPTRVVHNQTPSALDYVLTNDSCVRALNYEAHIADHKAQVISYPCSATTSDTPSVACTHYQKRFFDQQNLFQLNFQLSRTDFSPLYTIDSVDESWSFFWHNFIYCLDVACPIKKLKSRNLLPAKSWINPDVVEQSNHLKDVYWLSKSLDTQESRSLYNQTKKLFRERLELEKNNFFKQKIITSYNAKTIWRVINTNLGRVRNQLNISKIKTDEYITNSKDIGNEFCTFFATSAETLIESSLGSSFNSRECTTCSSNLNSMFFPPLIPQDLLSALTKLKNRSACSSLYDIPVSALEQVWTHVQEPLCHILNLSLKSGIFPTALKSGEITPLFKKGDREIIENYRAITGLLTFSKLFEKTILNRLEVYLTKEKLISNCQHGFRKNFSTTTAGFSLLNFIYKELDVSHFVLAIFFDLTRAFDTINSTYLQIKMEKLGIRGPINDWLRSFTEDRTVRVKIHDTLSDPKKINCGVPQGSIISPLLFSLFINDLDKFLSKSNNKVILYADDCTVVISANSLQELEFESNEILQKFSQWCSKNRLLVNNSKTCFMPFFLRREFPENPLLMLGNKPIERVTNFKFLGVYLDPRLKWCNHLDHVVSKLNSAFFAIRNLKNILDRKELLNTYYALAYSHMSYGIMFWGQSTDLARIFVQQKRILRKIFSLNPLDSCRPYFLQHRILPLPCILIFHSVLFVRKHPDLFTLNSSVHSHNTRSSTFISIPLHKTSSFQKGPYCFCSHLYNHLPSHLKQLPSYNKFKKGVKSYLVEKCFYSVNDFFRILH